MLYYAKFAEESRLFRESADVFNMLVSIYGSKELFVNEYQQLLAERLVANGWDRHLQSEFAYLETMKRRFSEGELSHCEVRKEFVAFGQMKLIVRLCCETSTSRGSLQAMRRQRFLFQSARESFPSFIGPKLETLSPTPSQ